ncbi:hypothetical protein BZG02_04595 [Labilibaculum filiforme]|uniref:Beta-lactamase-inhibitor-like PepSY-like domain-containing protein n=1 Tax=Labilibaculum filiforme TaxID=1940526 RepID=A0A2N3I484_9BACT|nr:hypothetical protein [Labilibaculum filiforme]PKQ65114.1 hypothetical protein BZG02_04595 [Labilibaculum filiforme]
MKRVLVMSATALLFSLSIPAFAANGNVTSEFTVAQEEVKYEEIKAEELPKLVQEGLSKSYSDFAILKSYIGNDGSYKVILSAPDQNIAVFYSVKGEFVKQEDLDV